MVRGGLRARRSRRGTRNREGSSTSTGDTLRAEQGTKPYTTVGISPRQCKPVIREKVAGGSVPEDISDLPGFQLRGGVAQLVEQGTFNRISRLHRRRHQTT